MNKNILFVNDDPLDGLGGASATFKAFFIPELCDFVLTNEFNKSIAEKYKTIVFGNIFRATSEAVDAIVSCVQSHNVYVMAFDYNFCAYRSPLLKKLNRNSSTDPYSGNGVLRKLWEAFGLYAKEIFFMSERQRKIYINTIGLQTHNTNVISSAFHQNDWNVLNNAILTPVRKSGTWCVISGIDDHQRFCKGTDNAIDICKASNFKYDLIPYTTSYKDFINTLAKYSGLVYVPNNWDTCPRVVIEARFLGLNLILNTNVQHYDESWWQGSFHDMYCYLKGRPDQFWSKITK